MVKKVTLSVDPVVHEKAKRILKQAGIPMSAFFTIALHGLVDSEHAPLKDMYENMLKGFMKHVTKP